jgi:hypothetical protein
MTNGGNEFNCKILPLKKMYPKYYSQVRINLPYVVWRVKMLGDSACKSHTVKKVNDFPVPSRDVTNKLSLAGNNLNIPLSFLQCTLIKKKIKFS